MTARIAMVTGANQGIGFALVEGLAAGLNADDLVLLTGRNAGRVADGHRARRQVPGDAQPGRGPGTRRHRRGAVARLAAELGAVDVVDLQRRRPRSMPDRPQVDQADEFIGVANGGTHAMLRSFGPVLRPGGRLIVVASSLGTLGHLDPRLQPLFDNVSLADIEATVEAWRTAVHAGTRRAAGLARWINVPSKVAQVAAVRAVARERRDTDLPTGTLVASVCPGLVDTRASRPWFDDFSQARTPEQAARPILRPLLADHVDPATYGELVRFGEVLPWLAGSSSIAQTVGTD